MATRRTKLSGQSEEDTPLASAPVVASGARVRRHPEQTKAWVQAKAAEALARQRSAQEQSVLQAVLPLWTDERRGIPNPMLRSGLFGSGSTRTFVKDRVVASLSNYTIKYRGESLLQDDLSVLIALLHKASRQAFGDTIFLTGYEIVKDLGWRMHSETYERVKESIARLKSNELKISLSTGTAGYSGSIIREYAWDASTPDGGTKWMVRFEPMLTALFKEDSTTFLHWEQRKRIGTRAALAQWLHAYFTSHRDPLPISVAKIHELSGSEAKNLRYFKAKLKAALEVLVGINFLTSYHISDGGMVTVRKAPTLVSAVTQRLLT